MNAATVLNLTDAQILTLAAAQREASEKAYRRNTGWIVPPLAAAHVSAAKLRAWQLAMNPNPTPMPVKEYANG
ncbi:hypothetical protein GCM10011608_09420 [Micromonospora sonchi]|uniref:Uncharacterized protein n=1 Tax=Micromonospora sonchi TaxID=1763543 RepID=A0A917TKF1_9ACTN|nr:hypothetical protein [Micromonospora sonchi]GGM26704.1 hypothetical protein GCM10011608_09420 [Micromonospora sonchi]